MSNFGKSLRSQRYSQGFTLIEVIIALVILSGMLTVLYTTFFQVSEGTKSLTTAEDQALQVRMAAKIVVTDLRGAVYLDSLAAKGLSTGMFGSLNSSVGKLFSRINLHTHSKSQSLNLPLASNPYLHEIEYRVEQDRREQGKRVLKRREDYYIDNNINFGGDEVTLLENVTEFKLEYLEADFGDDLERWKDTWQSSSEEKMPRAIRITIGAGTTDESSSESVLEVNLNSYIDIQL